MILLQCYVLQPRQEPLVYVKNKALYVNAQHQEKKENMK